LADSAYKARRSSIEEDALSSRGTLLVPAEPNEPRNATAFDYLERGGRDSLEGGISESDGRAVVDVCPGPVAFSMTTNTSVTSQGANQPYVGLQQQIHDALRQQHPEWVQPNGDCPTCESYESRLAELLEIFESNGRRSVA